LSLHHQSTIPLKTNLDSFKSENSYTTRIISETAADEMISIPFRVEKSKPLVKKLSKWTG